MTKRSGPYEHTTCKKPRRNNFNPDDLWGEEDLDVSVIDDCFKLAENYEQDNVNCTQLNNVSILPSYDAFKKQPSLISSTQSTSDINSHRPTTSGATNPPPISPRFSRYKSAPLDNSRNTQLFEQRQNDLPTIQKLQEKLQAKDGEVSILRSQLKGIRANIETERQKREKEWNEKLLQATKEMNVVKTQLDFKDLEITNLKQKVQGITKHIQLEASFNNTQSPASKIKITNEREIVPQVSKAKNPEISFKTDEIQPVFSPWYPLKSRIPPLIFNIPKQEKYFFDVNSTLSKTSLKFSRLEDTSTTTLKKTIFEQSSNTKLNLKCILSDIDTLIRLDKQQLASSEVIPCVERVLCASLQLITQLLSYLKQLIELTKTEHVIQADVAYLKDDFSCRGSNGSIFDGKEMFENEIGISARQSVAFLAELFLYNPYLRDCLLKNKSLEINNRKELFEIGSPFETKPAEGTSYFNVVLSCVQIIGKLRKSNVCVGFLCAVTKLLSNVFQLCVVSVNPLLFTLTKELIFARPNTEVLCELSLLLKNASQDAEFVEKLCTMSPENAPKTNSKEGFLNYDNDSCVFHVLVVLFENNMKYLSEMNEHCRENLLCFLYNALATNCAWLCYREDKLCDCLYQFNKLAVGVIYGFLQSYKQKRKERIVPRNCLKKRFENLFSISVRLLNLLNFKMSLLIEKYLALYSQFKIAVGTILEFKEEMQLKENGVKLLEKLQETEDIIIASDKFKSISLWL